MVNRMTLPRPAALLAALILTAAVAHAQQICDPHTFGAKADGHTKDTAAIQQAIDACSAKGGTVTLAGGIFVSGPIALKSNVTLDIATDATLLGSPDHADYAHITEFRTSGVQSLITATNASNVAITGGGTVDGNGESWWALRKGAKDFGVLGNDHPRPHLVVFDHSKHIRMEGPTFQNSGFWQIVPYYSDDIIIRNIKILAPEHAPNTDAIDPFSSSNIVIDHVYADVGDDNIAIKSGPIDSPDSNDPSRNIHIYDCTFMHGHGVSIGSELAGGAHNILVERIHFKGTDNGVRVKANRDRGNDVGNIIFRDLTMEDVKTAILISEYYPKALPEGAVAAAPITRLTPLFHDITIENLTATGSKVAGVVVGLPESPLERIVLKNINITADTGITVGYAQVNMQNVVVHPTKGAPIISMAEAHITGK